MLDKIIRYVAIVSIVASCAFAFYSFLNERSSKAKIAELQNAVASRDLTIETQDGVYKKLMSQNVDLKRSIVEKDDKIKSIEQEIKDNGEKLLIANQLVVKWKKTYEAYVKAHQTEVSDNGVIRKKVEFEKDFGYIGVSGFTLTDPPEAFVKVRQNRPLKLTLFVSQNKDGSWSTRTVSSESDIGIDIALASIDPLVLQERWYEKIGLSLDLAAGNSFLLGAGLSYEFGRFTVGPKVWIDIGDKVDKFVGIGLSWNPFKR